MLQIWYPLSELIFSLLISWTLTMISTYVILRATLRKGNEDSNTESTRERDARIRDANMYSGLGCFPGLLSMFLFLFIFESLREVLTAPVLFMWVVVSILLASVTAGIKLRLERGE